MKTSLLSTSLHIRHFPHGNMPFSSGRSFSQLCGVDLVNSDLTSSSPKVLALFTTISGLGPLMSTSWGERLSRCLFLLSESWTSSYCEPCGVIILTGSGLCFWSCNLTLLASSNSDLGLWGAFLLDLLRVLCGCFLSLNLAYIWFAVQYPPVS